MRILVTILMVGVLLIGLSGVGFTESLGSNNDRFTVTTNNEEPTVPEPEPNPDPIPNPDPPETIPEPEPEKPPDSQPNPPKPNPNPSPVTDPKPPPNPKPQPQPNPTPTTEPENPRNPVIPPPSPTSPPRPIEEVEVEETTEVMDEGIVNIDEYLSLLGWWKNNSFEVLYVPAVYDLMRYHYEEGIIMELDHLSQAQLTELSDFLNNEPILRGSVYDDMREVVREYLR
ncbi:hypothetical protein [Sutcliffiella rhizosphaerae]|uniref:Uncharacterized protein n=1 Tax=Sutcliffiella rhizosphaerae TaxID=2880967 RepID=A0ABM8YJR2_9BACI|nr:hypothetical protein [Sutcliffiella rhizosphaerae]CAG9620169.1 hypothetical protein BACCIP111883_00937 [Sutcliffiella rhizosphaerae]